MGAMKKFEMFCRDHDLNPANEASWEHYQFGTDPAPERCPKCRRAMNRGYCYYCGTGERRPAKSKEERERDEARALATWNEAERIANTPAEHYLRHHRMIAELPPNVDEALRWHPRCPCDHKQRVPAMVALLRDVSTDHRPCGIDRTPIYGDRGKLDQPKVYGTYYRTAIKLWGEPVAGRLTIGEGIETVLSAVELMPHLAPAWAVGTANNLGMFPILDEVEELHILADNDPAESGRVGQAKAKQCAGRYSAFAKRAETHTPRRHKDFNDILRELRRAR
jgi:hypothetical protein